MFQKINGFLNKKASLVAVLGLLCLFLFSINKGFILTQDSGGYISKEMFRSPLYPLLLSFMQFLFGAEKFFPVVVFQLIFGFVACFLMSKTLQKQFNLNGFLFLWTLGLGITPYVFNYGNHILSEGLAYPLFLLSIVFLFKGLGNRHIKSILWFFVWLSLLILTRRQYLFLYVVGFFAYLFFVFFAKKTKRKWSILLALLASLLITDFSERLYHYHYHHKFVLVPFLGIQLITLPMYLAVPDDIKLYKNPEEAKIFLSVYSKMEQQQCHANTLEQKHPEFSHFHLNYNKVSWNSVGATMLIYEDGVRDWVKIDKILMNMAWPLIKEHKAQYLALYMVNLIQGMGGYYIFFLMGFCFLATFYYYCLNRDRFSLLLFFSILINYGNCFLVALVEPSMTRYLFSTNIILVNCLTAFMYLALKKSFLLDKENHEFTNQH